MKNARYYLFKLLANRDLRESYNDYAQSLTTSYDHKSYTEHRMRLNSILRFTAKNVPFFSNVKHIDLSYFPITNKEIIRECYGRFLAKNIKTESLKVRQTGGSTGVPFRVYWDNNKAKRNRASFIYHYEENGYFIGDKLFYFRAWNKKNKQSTIKKIITNMVEQNCTANIYDVRLFIKNTKGAKSVLWGYPSAMIDYAKVIKELGEDVGDIKVIYTSSETLTDQDRFFLAESFNCPVFSRYSNEENGIIAQQFSTVTNIFRVNWPSVWVEILKQDSDEPAEEGETGRVVVTDLDNYALPFIRYDTGDLSMCKGKYEDSTFLIGNIEGRMIDRLQGINGDVISPFHINNLASQKSGSLQSYQFIQHKPGKYTMRVVAKSGFNESEFHRELFDIVGDSADIKFEYVDSIPLTKSGKRKYIINECIS